MIIAWGLLLTITTLCTVYAETMYKIIDIGSGRLYPPPPDFPTLAVQSGRSSLAGMLAFTTSLWAVKISFMLFFWRLGVAKVHKLRLHWWVVMVLTVLCYLANFPHIEYLCFVGSYEELMVHQCDTLLFTMRFNCALDIITDFLSQSTLLFYSRQIY